MWQWKPIVEPMDSFTALILCHDGWRALSNFPIWTLEHWNKHKGAESAFSTFHQRAPSKFLSFLETKHTQVAIQGKDESWPLVIVRSWMVTMETAIISLAENRVTLTIIGHCPLMVTAENSNTGHGAAYILWSLWWSMVSLCATIIESANCQRTLYLYENEWECWGEINHIA